MGHPTLPGAAGAGSRICSGKCDDAITGGDAQIRAEIKRLEEARDECNDGGIRRQIEAWIKELKQKLESEQSKR